MTKQEQIEARKLKPIEVGDDVLMVYPYVEIKTEVVGRGKKKEEVKTEITKTLKVKGKVLSIDGSLVTTTKQDSSSIPIITTDIVVSYPQRYYTTITYDIKYCQPTYDDCGVNPFVGEMFDINFYHTDITTLLFKMNLNNNGEENTNETFRGINMNPYVYNQKGEREYYQRGLVWTLEQKQLLIDSIYNGIEIGKFLFRYNSWERLEELRMLEGKGYGMDCVDGKQRLNAIISFLRNEFPDSLGNYWSDLSQKAQSKFLHYRNLAYGEMQDGTTDKEVIKTFLTLNFTGVAMSKEHITFIKSIKVK
jgi:hypothetical protein